MGPNRRFTGIDQARALAALSVVFAHFIGPVLPRPLKYVFTGHPAVIAFFVISGFCIHYPFISKSLSIPAFWAARWIRLMIPATVAIFLAKALQIPGFNFVEGYILWSLVCELFYYSIYPLFLVFSRYVSWNKLCVLSTAGSYSIVILLGSDSTGSAHIYGPMLNWLVSMPAWLVGCCLAEFVFKTESSAARWPFGSVALWRIVVGATASLLYWATTETPLGFYMTMNIFAIVAAIWINSEIQSHHSYRWLEWMGKWSFSIYLFHAVVHSAVFRSGLLPDLGDVALRVITLPLIIAGCYLCYLLAEYPSHQLARAVFKTLNRIERLPTVRPINNEISVRQSASLRNLNHASFFAKPQAARARPLGTIERSDRD